MAEFEELVILRWDTAEAIGPARELLETLKQLDPLLSNTLPSAALRFSTGAGVQFQAVRSTVQSLNRDLQETIVLMEQAGRAQPGAASNLLVAIGNRGAFTTLGGLNVPSETGGGGGGGGLGVGGGAGDDSLFYRIMGRNWTVLPDTARRASEAAQAAGLSLKEYNQILAIGEGTQRQYAASLRTTTQATRGAGDATDILSNRFARHITWIAQGILIWTAIRTTWQGVTAIVRELTTEIIQLESATARLTFVGGGGRQETFGAAYQAAQFGVPPIAGMQGAITAAQFGVGADVQRQAAQLALVFGTGKDNAQVYANAIQELAQTQMRASAAGIQHINMLDTIATMYRTIPGSLEDYFDALQLGIALQQQFGGNAEQLAVALMRAATAAEVSPAVIAGTLGRIAMLWEQPERLQRLQGFGITAVEPGAGLRQIAEVSRQLIQQGDIDRAGELFRIISGGSIQSRTDIRNMALVLSEFNNAMEQGEIQAGEFERAFSLVSDTTQVKINQLTEAWRLFLAALGTTKPIQDAIGLLGDFLGDWRTMLLYLGARPAYESFTGKAGVTERAQALALQDPEFMRFFNYLQRGGTAEQYFGDEGMRARGLGGGYAPPGRVAPSIRQDEALPRAPDFYTGARQFFMPEGVTREQFSATYMAAKAELEKIPGYKPEEGKYLVFDEAGNYIKAMNYEVHVLALTMKRLDIATNQAADALAILRDFGGIRRLPEDVGFQQFRAGVMDWERILTTQMAQWPSLMEQWGPPQTFAFLDPNTRQLQLITAHTEAIQEYTQSMDKTLKAQLTGVFNVPAGETVWVAFQALAAKVVPFDRLSQMGGRGGVPTGGAGAEGLVDYQMGGGGTGGGGVTPSSAYYLPDPKTGVNTQVPSSTDYYRAWYAKNQGLNVITPPVIKADPGSPSFIPLPGYDTAPAPTGGGAYPSTVNVSLQTRNVIMLDGRKIAESLNSMYFPELSRLGRGSQLSVGTV